MSDQLQPQSGSHGTPPPAAIVDGAAKPLPRRSPTPNERARTDAPPPSNEAPGLHEEAVRGTQDAPGAAAGGDQDQEGGEPPADATTEASAAAESYLAGRPEADLVPVVGPVENPAPAAPIAALPVVGPAKSGGAAPHARPGRSARGPWEIERRNRRENDSQDPPPLTPLIIAPKYCPFIQQSAKYTLAFGTGPCRNRILALFEFWANGLQKEDGVVLIETSYTWICQGLFFEFSRHEVSRAMDRLHEIGLITRPDHGHQVIRQKNGVDRKKRRSMGGRDVLTFHVDTVNERIRNAIVGTDGYRFPDWMNLLFERLPEEYHKAAKHTGPYNQCTACTGLHANEATARAENQGTAYTGSPVNQGAASPGADGSNQGTASPGGRVPDGLVKAQTRVPGALHKRSTKEGKEQEPPFPLPSSSKTENAHTVTEAPVQAGAPTPNPPWRGPLPPPAKEPENELQGSSVTPLEEDLRVREILDNYSDQLTPNRHASLIAERLKNPEFAAHYISVLDDAYRIVNERIPKPVLWALKQKKDGTENWVKVLEGEMIGFMTGPRRVPATVQSLAQDARSAAATQKPAPTAKELYAKRRRPLENRADALGLLRHPEFNREYQRRHEESLDNGDQLSLDWLEKILKYVDQMGWAKPGKPLTEEVISSLLVDAEFVETGVSADVR